MPLESGSVAQSAGHLAFTQDCESSSLFAPIDGSLASRRCIRFLRGPSRVRSPGDPLTKICSRCHEEKPVGEFNRKDGERRQPFCRSCQSKWYSDYYRNNEKERKRLRASQERKRAEMRTLIDSLKSGNCVDCGHTFHPCAMDFDHIKDNKGFDVARAMRDLPTVKKLMEEVAKCELVCACCHRVRTWKRQRSEIV